MRHQRARPRFGGGRPGRGGKKPLDHPRHFAGIAGIETAGHGGRTNVNLVRREPAVNRIPLENPQFRVVIFPGVARQTGLDAHLFQQPAGIQPMVHGYAGQQQSAGRAAANLHPVLADDDCLGAILAAGQDRLRPPENPHVHVELVQLVGHDAGKTRIVGRGPIGGAVQRPPERHRRFDVPAAGAQSARPLQADEGPVDRRACRLVQQTAARLGPLAPHGRGDALARGAKNRGLLLRAKHRPRRAAGRFRGLR